MGRAKRRNDLYVQLPFGVTLDVGSIAPSSRFSRSSGPSTKYYEDNYRYPTHSAYQQPTYSAGSYQTSYTSTGSRPIYPEYRRRYQHTPYRDAYDASVQGGFPASPPPFSSSSYSHQSKDRYWEQAPPQPCIRIGDMEYSLTLNGIKAASRALADQEAACRQLCEDHGLRLDPIPAYAVKAMEVATFATERQPHEVIEKCGKVLQAFSRRLDQARMALEQEIRQGHV